MKHDPRYAIFSARAVFDTRLTAIDVRILAALGTEGERQGWVQMSQGEIAERLSVHRISINRSVKRLVELGYLQHVTQSVPGLGKVASLYRVITDLPAPEAVMEAAEEASSDPMLHKATSLETDVAPHVTTHVAKPDTHVAPELQHKRSVSPSSQATLVQSPQSPAGRKAQGRRLPADWRPRTDEVTFGVNGGLTEAEVHGCAEHFRDHFEASTRPTARKSNWDQAFRNWLRTAISDARRGRRPVVVGLGKSGEWSQERRLSHFRETGEWFDRWGPRPDLFQAMGGAA